MSSEEMRVELELFVNQGLQQGWRGWPRHESRGTRGTDRINRTNRAFGTSPDLRFFDRSYVSYGSYPSN
ncbi:MAG: hypothetical protein MUC88_09270 [Planctomycetes bacterium]|jgi:hypothetical protein|nr:hypothetical protein [Planctomycetota bacterium]